MTDPWKSTNETLIFQFGPFVLGRWTFESLSNRTSPLAPEAGALKLPPILQPTTYQQLLDNGTILGRVNLRSGVIRYVAYHGKRYFVDLSSRQFADYLSRFSAKTRNTLKRKLRHLAAHSGETVDFRVYRSPDEMLEFRRHALAVSVRSYQRKIGFGLPETKQFAESLTERAKQGCVCGFVLFHSGRPISYVFCRIERDIVVYSYCGYDPEFAQFSPGTVLLLLIIEWLFNERAFRLFDLDNDGWDYKAMFATGNVSYLKVVWFPKTITNFLLVIMHLSVLWAWSGAALIKEAYRTLMRAVRSAIMKLHNPNRLGARPRERSALSTRTAPKLNRPRQASHG
jgi:hypothetical protein